MSDLTVGAAWPTEPRGAPIQQGEGWTHTGTNVVGVEHQMRESRTNSRKSQGETRPTRGGYESPRTPPFGYGPRDQGPATSRESELEAWKGGPLPSAGFEPRHGRGGRIARAVATREGVMFLTSGHCGVRDSADIESRRQGYRLAEL